MNAVPTKEDSFAIYTPRFIIASSKRTALVLLEKRYSLILRYLGGKLNASLNSEFVPYFAETIVRTFETNKYPIYFRGKD